MKYKITPQVLRAITGVPGNPEVINGLVQYLPPLLYKYKLNNHLRVAHFLAQIGHETDHFRTLQEYASGAAYEGRDDLGNTHRGDGRRYRGRGALQITGRYNYRKYGQKIGVDLENNPELARHPENSIKTALEYWVANNLNTLADQDNVKSITKRINGGFNGLQSRMDMLKRAKIAVKRAEYQDDDLDFDRPVAVARPEPKPEPIVEQPKPEPKFETKPVTPASKKVKNVPKITNVKFSQPVSQPKEPAKTLYDPDNEPGDDASEFVRSQLSKDDG